MKYIALAATALCALVPSVANAAVDIYISETAGGALAQTIGSLNLTGLSVARQATSLAAVRGDNAYIGTGAGNRTENGYAITGSSTAFGMGTGYVFAASSAGTAFALQIALGVVFIDSNYVSGSTINSTATFNQNFFDIGLTPGTYNFATANDAITVHIGQAAPAAVPEAATWALMVAGFGLVGAAMRRRSTSVTFA